MLRIHSIILTTALISTAFAQDAAEPKFDGKIVLRAAARANWEISFKPSAAMKIQEKDEKEKKPRTAVIEEPQPEEGAPTIEEVRSIKVEKSNKLYHETATFRSGTKVEKWCLGDLQFSEQRSSKILAKDNGDITNDSHSDYSVEDFAELAWLSKEHYKGVITYQNLPCFLFQVGGDKRPMTRKEVALSKMEDSGFVKYEGTVTVILSAATRLPLLYDDGTILRLYRHETGTLNPLVPPQKFAEQFTAWQKHKAALKKPVPDP